MNPTFLPTPPIITRSFSTPTRRAMEMIRAAMASSTAFEMFSLRFWLIIIDKLYKASPVLKITKKEGKWLERRLVCEGNPKG